jgi:transcriptional regulator with XRE-family HTH domain
MMGAAMPRSRTGRAAKEQVENPRPRNGNTYAVGAYLQELREQAHLTREPMVRQILDDMKRNITMSLSTLGKIETGQTKGVGAATIDAVRRVVRGDPYDISELYRLPIPEEDDEEGIAASRLEGKSRAIARTKLLTGTSESALRELAAISEVDMRRILKSTKKEQLLSLAARLADDPKALSLVLSILKELNN